jgi:hypothetical protein
MKCYNRAMDRNRRDLLKLFGIGATVVPLIGGTPEMDAPAKLIEVPKLEPVSIAATDPREILESLGKHEMIVSFKSQDGRTTVFRADTFVTEYSIQAPPPISITDVKSARPPSIIPYLGSLQWELRGVLCGDIKPVRF